MKAFVKSNLAHCFKSKKILLGITGSIAAFKACDVIRFLKDCGAEVRVVLTQGAENFVTRTTLETLSGSPVMSQFWELGNSQQTHGTHHIETARWADLILVAPASAHFIGKMANGLADDLLSTEILAFRGPVLVAPAMNPSMYSHPAVQENLRKIVSHGVRILGPTSGLTACGEEGLGRMIEPDEIVQMTAQAFYEPKLGKKALITLGPTRSAVDPVRYISNRSSGLMGASLCWAAVQKGYDVTAVCGPVDVSLPQGIEVIRVQTAEEMANATLNAWKNADVLIAAAAVLDWSIRNPAKTKIKKEEGFPTLEFEKTRDILALASEQKKSNQFVLGFAAETNEPIANAHTKLKRKKCDAIFVNDVSRQDEGFESQNNSGWWISLPENVTRLESCPKPELARKLIERLHSTTVGEKKSLICEKTPNEIYS